MRARRVNFKNTPNTHFLLCLSLEFARNRCVEHCVGDIVFGAYWLKHSVRAKEFAALSCPELFANNASVILSLDVIGTTGVRLKSDQSLEQG